MANNPQVDDSMGQDVEIEVVEEAAHAPAPKAAKPKKRKRTAVSPAEAKKARDKAQGMDPEVRPVKPSGPGTRAPSWPRTVLFATEHIRAAPYGQQVQEYLGGDLVVGRREVESLRSDERWKPMLIQSPEELEAFRKGFAARVEDIRRMAEDHGLVVFRAGELPADLRRRRRRA